MVHRARRSCGKKGKGREAERLTFVYQVLTLCHVLYHVFWLDAYYLDQLKDTIVELTKTLLIKTDGGTMRAQTKHS